MFFVVFVFLFFPSANLDTRWVVRSRPAGEEEEPPGARGHGSKREFTHRRVYKRVWVRDRNMVVMVAEMT